MKAFLGLSTKVVQEFVVLTKTLKDLGLTPETAPDGLLNNREKQLCRMVNHLANHPEDNLWQQHPSTL